MKTPPVNISPKLPAYALDGRPLEWNAERTAVRFDSTNEEYHSDRNAVSSSMLKVLDRSPAHLREYLLTPQQSKSAFVLGSAIHCAVLEPADFAQRFAVYSGSRLGNNCAWKDFKARNSHRDILSQKDHALVMALARQVHRTVVVRNGQRSFTFADLLQHGSVEKNIYWLDKKTSLTCRLRYDLLVHNVLVDLKSTTDAREGAFSKDANKFLYHVQMSHYVNGINAFRPSEAGRTTAILMAVEKEPPFEAKAHKLDWVSFLDVGQERLESLMNLYSHCLHNNRWPGYTEATETLKLPQWALYDHMNTQGAKRPGGLRVA